jgi:hypothetical protein
MTRVKFQVKTGLSNGGLDGKGLAQGQVRVQSRGPVPQQVPRRACSRDR